MIDQRQALRLFQFQYGAIESISEIASTSEIMMFQFQYGAIESDREVVVGDSLTCFNSNMVRLRESATRLPC